MTDHSLTKDQIDPAICGDDGPITPEQCALWLDAKYRRHGELEDRAAAMWLRKLSTRLPAEPSERPCTCHPDDNPPRPCPRKYALSECRKAAAYREQVNSLALECAESTRRAAEKSGAVLVVDDKPYNESGGGG